MTTRLTLVCSGATASARAGGFASPDEPLDAAGVGKAMQSSLPGPKPTAVITSSSLAARQTAAAVGLEALVTPAIDDTDWGGWAGRSFADVQAACPDDFAGWLTDPSGGAPDGESFIDVQRRVADWFGAIGMEAGRIVAVTHPMVIRALLTLATGMSIEPAMRIDIAPLSTTELSFHRGWRLQELRRP